LKTEAEGFFNERDIDVATLTGYCVDFNFERFTYLRQLRDQFIRQFGFAIITCNVIKKISGYGPLVEVGSGSGYWAYELRKAGIDVIATDPATGKYRWGNTGGHWETPWLDIERITGVEAVEKYPDRGLLTIWPDYDEPWAAETLRAFKGTTVLYGGEGRGGCTGDDAFHDVLEDCFEEIESIALPQFDCIHDRLEVWKRK
jgi:hypothetical protein